MPRRGRKPPPPNSEKETNKRGTPEEEAAFKMAKGLERIRATGEFVVDAWSKTTACF